MGVNGKNWYVGMTTIPERYYMPQNPIFGKTVNSLRQAGFDIDKVRCDEDRLGIVANFTLLAWEAYLTEPNCQRFLFVQDDVIFSKNLRQYLDTLKVPVNGYWNLYITPENEERIPKAFDSEGFHISNQMGRGALALVFSNQALREILTSSYFVNKVREVGKNSRKSLDRAIVKGCSETRAFEWVHYPSLCNHIGTISTLGNQFAPTPNSWRGEDFDCLTLLRQTQ